MNLWLRKLALVAFSFVLVTIFSEAARAVSFSYTATITSFASDPADPLLSIGDLVEFSYEIDTNATKDDPFGQCGGIPEIMCGIFLDALIEGSVAFPNSSLSWTFFGPSGNPSTAVRVFNNVEICPTCDQLDQFDYGMTPVVGSLWNTETVGQLFVDLLATGTPPTMLSSSNLPVNRLAFQSGSINVLTENNVSTIFFEPLLTVSEPETLFSFGLGLIVLVMLRVGNDSCDKQPHAG